MADPKKAKASDGQAAADLSILSGALEHVSPKAGLLGFDQDIVDAALSRLEAKAHAYEAINAFLTKLYGSPGEPLERVKSLTASEERARNEAAVEQAERHRVELERDALAEALAQQRSQTTAAEAGRRGGSRTREIHPELFRKIGALGGKKVAEKGPGYFQEIGKRGGQQLAQRGSEHFRAIGKKGGAKTAAKGTAHFQEMARKRWKK